jgi:hypothetical protein
MLARQAVIRLSGGLGKALGVNAPGLKGIGLKRGLSWRVTDQGEAY